ncbi:Thiamine pyrophosphate-requiring enzyme [Planctomycetales bacterium 10988]|nr:Thiamine pyrophosphate-requiring enzyme [Planctomycetales bacterium 10988]
MKASDLFIRCLETEEIEYVFGVPGEENADFLMSLEKSSSIKFILCRHEQAAAFMAEVYGRLTGNPAVCLGTLGPGATNLITGVADGNMDRAPLLVITGQGDTKRLHKESHQVMDVVSMYRPVTKFSYSVRNAENIPEIVRKAVRLARTEKPGACLIELPEDIAKKESDGEPIPVRKFRRPVPDDKIIDRAWDAIQKAKRPIILAGNGCIRKRASSQLREFVEQTGIGVVCTFMGKGCVDLDDETCCFTIGLQDRDFTAQAVEESDLVITLGYDMVEYPPRLWNPHGERKIIHCDFIPAEIDADYPIAVEVVGDLAHTLWMLNERVKAHGGDRLDFDHSHTRRARVKMQEEFELHAKDDAVGAIKPQKALWDTRQALGPHDILLSDVGAHKLWVARHYQCHEPNTCLISNGFCSMGFALPGAMAASLVYPDRKVVAICGDGAVLMNSQDMETAKRLNLSFVVQVWCDEEYGLISWKQDNEFGRHTELGFTNPDFVKLAEAFGWGGHYCDDSQKFQQVLQTALDEPGPSLIAMPIDYRENRKLTDRLGEISMTV